MNGTDWREGMIDIVAALIVGFVVGELATVLALWALWKGRNDDDDGL